MQLELAVVQTARSQPEPVNLPGGSSELSASGYEARNWTNAVLIAAPWWEARKETWDMKVLSTVPAGWSMPSEPWSW